MSESEGVFMILYGGAKTGKTLATVRAFPNGLFITPKGGLTCARWIDWEPKVIETDEKGYGIPQLVEVIKQAQDKYPAIIIDDFSIMCQTELQQCKKSHQGWSAFDVFNQRVLALRDAARNAKCHVILTMHEQAPKEVGQENEKRWVKGCPMVPGWQLPEKLPTHADIVARVVYDENAYGWPYLLQTGPDNQYITGDRLAITPERFPLNIREVLLLSELTGVARPDKLAFMDGWVYDISQDLAKEFDSKRPKVKSVLAPYVEKMQKEGVKDRWIRWILADALDRAQMEKHNNSLIDNFIGSL
jgi:hypothetical protein